MNKRGGEMAFTLLVVIALVASVTTLFYFLTFDSSIGNTPKEFSEVMSEIELGENYVINEAVLIGEQSIEKGGNIKENFKNIASERDFEISSFGNFYGKIRNDNFRFEFDNGGYLLEFKDLFIISRRGANEIVRNFNLSVEFDSGGKLRKVYK